MQPKKIPGSLENNPGFYKTNVDKINGTLDANFDDPKFVEKHAISFFGLSKKDLGLLTEEELQKFKNVTKFLAKRIINAQAQKMGPGSKRLELLLDEDLDTYNGILFHDISHSIGWFVFNNYNNADEKKYVPLFFQTPPDAEMNNARVLEQEMFASLWQAIRPGTLPTSLAILRKGGMKQLLEALTEDFPKEASKRVSGLVKVEAPGDLQEYIHDYLYFLYNILGAFENKFAISETAETLFPDGEFGARDTFIKRNQEQYDAIARNMIEGPHSLLVEMLSFIYENKDNPRVLVDLFLKYCEPIIKRTSN